MPLGAVKVIEFDRCVIVTTLVTGLATAYPLAGVELSVATMLMVPADPLRFKVFPETLPTLELPEKVIVPPSVTDAVSGRDDVE